MLRESPVGQGRSRLGIALAGGIIALVLIGFAIVLLNQQSDDRTDIEDNFRDRATVSAALTQSLFEASTTSGQQQNEQRYGTREVSPQTLAAAAKQGQSSYIVLLGPNGEVISSSPGTPQSAITRLGQRPEDVQTVMDGRPYGLSNVLRFPEAGLDTVEFTAPVDTDFGRRIIVSGVSPQLLAVFLGGYLKKVPNVGDGSAYVLDGTNAVIASTDPSPLGEPPDAPGLTEALSGGGDAGDFGDGRYFVDAPIEGSPWKVVSTAPEGTLFSSVTGAHKWVPWLIFGLLAIASAFALVLLVRVIRNSDQLAEANDRLEDANRALESRANELGRSNSELEQFASIASHDLKEPLRKVQTLTELLERKDADRLSDEGRDYIARTRAAGERMQDLIDDLLKFSRVATQGQPFEEVDLTKVANHAVSDLEAVIEETGGEVDVGHLPTVEADPTQMRQLIQNLLSNALKFHREDVPPQVRLSGRVRGRFAEVEIADNGIGFESKYNARIFKVFERLHGRTSYPGTGIGLALCRKIVDRHGGTITADSTPGEGSTFVVTLPLTQSMEATATTTNGDMSDAKPEPAHA